MNYPNEYWERGKKCFDNNIASFRDSMILASKVQIKYRHQILMQSLPWELN